MTPNPAIMQAVQQLGGRVTVGDVATQAGLDINTTEQGLLALASDAGGNLQVAESGDLVYQFPSNFRAILRNKFWQLRLQEWGLRIWGILFYLIRISFGILLIASIAIILIAIVMLLLAASASQGNRDQEERSNRSGGSMMLPLNWISPDFFWVFYPNYGYHGHQRQRTRAHRGSGMNFLEAIFSFLFGDGNPNADLADRRWQAIAAVIRKHRGAVIAEQITPYLDTLGAGHDLEFESYMLPVLIRFQGRPEVTAEGGFIYHFPELQTTATERQSRSVATYLEEYRWEFSQASSWQKLGAAGLGGLNLVAALVLGSLLQQGDLVVAAGAFVAFVQSIYWVLLGYGVAFLAVPLLRFLWLQRRNHALEVRNSQRQQRAIALTEADDALRKKLKDAKQFASETVIHQEDAIYTTDRDLLEQEVDQSARIDEEWQRRLDQASSEPGSADPP
ncbi:hypothetical protein DO97_00355 [Neosynechococcus sphagnicola sy1]|uniref:Uncharacterized protein n=1 Tax=Neosynechococcus sphagnicola sy1 TaxID=1497020 RepID=A0A098TNZ2_9CYAN|nr:hypothetical protein [Neosynechococcus sphagnicola]KGF74014.1 hypothetical protein DO97_00355 [Neosynechococcus sphagnicola sy1]